MSNSEITQTFNGDLVVVGASAGGIQALSTFVSTLPTNFPAPIVLAQHLDPNRPSNLHHILQRRTTLPVMLVTSSAVLEVGKIYVVPANRHILVKDHHVEVQDDRGKRPRPSIDALLTSAAEVYNDRLIAVILTGSGSDGAAGAVDVKNAGGTVIVQDPHTARYPSMPLALPPPIVDFEASIENIASLLYNLLTGVHVVQSEERTEDTLQSILELVSHQASVDFRQYKTSTILRRISRRMTVTHVHTIRDYEEYLRNFPEEIGELVKAFLINVTQFFRDVEAFAYLRHEILSKLIAKARDQDKVLRFWTAGCATGEEPYSLAMLISDMLGAELSAWSIKIFATDLDDDAIAFARRGIYSENLVKTLPNEYRDRYFEHVEQGYRISKILRQMVIFGQQDLSRSAPFPRINLVLCRNVLIYFSPELQDYVLNQFAFSLSPEGYLFLGKAETVRPQQSFFELISKQWKVYRCTGGALPSIRRQNLPELTTSRQEGRALSRLSKSMSIPQDQQDGSPVVTEYGQLRRFNELLLRFLPIGIVVIDRNYHMLTANGAARRLLGFRDITNDQDFLHAVHGIPYAVTRTAIDTVFRERNAVTLPEIELEITSGGNGRFLSLSIALMQTEANAPELAAISISDVTEQVQFRRQLETAQTEQTQLMNELSTTNKRLSYVNKELMDANEELQVANEELMLTHEELQASIEEFETTNEELQATNEELETNNEELQATNEELETTNEELRARTNELQEVASTLDTERIRLAEIVELAPFYIMVLRGPMLMVEAYNPNYAHMLDAQSVQNRSLDEIAELFWDVQLAMTLAQKAHEVYQRDEKRTISRTITTSKQQTSPEESFFVYTLVPSHDVYGHVNGVIMYSLDETEQHTRDVQEERAQLKLIFDNTTSALLALYDATTTRLVVASPNYLSMLTPSYQTHALNETSSTWYDTTIIQPQEQAEAIWNSVLETRTAIRLPEVQYTSGQNNSETFWDCSITPVQYDKQHEVRYILVLMVDVTEQVRARRELERLDSIKDDFLSLTTHELRTPLTTVLGNAQILLKSLKKQATQLSDKDSQRGQFEQWVGNLDKIVYQTNKMNAMISEMVDVTRLNGKVFELHTTEGVDIVDLVQRVIEQQKLADGDKHPIEFTPSTNTAIGTVDAARVEQVLNNLVSNALKYSPAGKPVSVAITYAKDETDLVIVSVRDEGYGISEEEQQHIFDRFYRASSRERADGLGLGLYIAREIVTQQGGRMWMESTPNVGSTFFFTLPLSK